MSVFPTRAMLVAGLRNNPDEMEGMRRGQPRQAQPWRATLARAKIIEYFGRELVVPS